MQSMRIARLLLNISVARLASVSEISERQIQRLERGEVLPNRATLRALDTAITTILDERIAEASARPKGRKAARTG
jgi:transcriptional regulator with XRE-family HTH domain